MKKNDIIDAEICGMTDLGYGVARVDGIVTFVDNAVTGDKASLKIIKVNKDTLVGRVEKIITPSSFRIENLCPNKRCGGCAYGNMTDGYELELKREFVRTAFKKNGVEISVAPVYTDGRRTGYRNKVQIPVEKGKYGYFAKHSHEIISCKGCVLAPEIFERITDYTVSLGLPLRHICIRRGEMTGDIMLTLVTERDYLPDEKNAVKKITERFPEITSVVVNTNKEGTNVILGEKSRAAYGEDIMYDVLCGCRFGISSKSFYQVNRGVAEALYGKATELAARDNPKTVADLFCGAGTIGLSMAKKYPGIKIRGIEIVPEAIENAKKNAALNGIENAEFICADATDIDGDALDGCDCVIVDPPRKGLTDGLIGTISDKNIGRVVYVSCNPETLARDVSRFISLGYTVTEAYPFDMFPRTGHVETVVLLCRRDLSH